MFIGLVLGGLLAAWDWWAVFWINLPAGVFGTLWAYLRLRDTGERHRGRIDWFGNITFALGLGAVLVGCTYGIQPYHGSSMGWESPVVLGELIGGAFLLAVFVIIETRVAEPMFRLALFKIRAFTFGNLAGLLVSIARGGIQFMLIIWLQGIWLPLHGYSYDATPLWAGIFLLPMTAGFLVSGPTSGILSDKFGSRGIATAGMAVFALSFVGLMLLPVNFPYWAFALLIAVNGIGSGMFASPNSSSIMGSVPARDRGAASGMRATFQNSGTAVSIGVVFTLMIAGLSGSLPTALTSGLTRQGVPAAVAHRPRGFRGPARRGWIYGQHHVGPGGPGAWCTPPGKKGNSGSSRVMAARRATCSDSGAALQYSGPPASVSSSRAMATPRALTGSGARSRLASSVMAGSAARTGRRRSGAALRRAGAGRAALARTCSQ